MALIKRNTGFTAILLTAVLASAIALFASCQRDPQPRGSGDIYVDLALAVTDNSTPATRLSNAIVQSAENDFRGISDIRIIPFGVTRQISSSDVPLNGTLSTWIGATVNDANTTGTGLMQNNHSRFYSAVYLPRTTGSLLFYGKASEASTNKAVYGSLVTNYTVEGVRPSTITFSPDPICPSGTPAAATAMAEYLSSIANVTPSGYVKWAVQGNSVLKALFDSFTNNVNPIQGSGKNLQALVSKLYAALSGLTPTGPEAALYTAYRTAIMEAIATGTTVAGTTVTFPSGWSGYPGSLGLPDGAACLRWNGTSFAVVTTSTVDTYVAGLNSICYPAALYYYANSLIRTSYDEDLESNYVPAKSWSQILSAYEFPREGDGPATITYSVRSVAMIDQVSYGVAQLQARVRAGSYSLPQAGGASFSFDNDDIRLTGVLVGKQQVADFSFSPTVSDEYMTYDSSLPAINLTTTAFDSQPVFRSLVLETNEGMDVRMALEFENLSGNSFRGVNGIIEPGTKFYLVANLDLDAPGSNLADTGRAFTKGSTTSVALQISSLANAYNVIPDLRDARLEVGIQLISDWNQSETTDVDLE